MKKIRCVKCKRLLGEVPKDIKAEIEMKCPKCRTIYSYVLGKDS